MSLMTKRSFRHWQKSSKKFISKITKQHIVVIIIIVIIVPAVPQIVQQPKVENSKPPLFYLPQDLRRHGNQIFKRLPPYRTKAKGGRSNADTLKRPKGWLQKSLQPHIRSKETTRVLQSIRESRVSLYRLLS